MQTLSKRQRPLIYSFFIAEFLKYKFVLPFSIFMLTSFSLSAQEKVTPVKALVVVAHPDDETGMAAIIYKITKEQGGIVDQAVITNGEGGYRYSLLAEPYYNLKLTDEKVGRENLPRIRKQELMNAGKIIGIRNHYFFDQKDAHYGLDVREPLDTTWNVNWVQSRLKELMTNNKYDFVFCLIPDSSTHAHHKAATILSLKTVQTLKEKPIVLGVSTSKKNDTIQKTFKQLENFPITKVTSGKPSFQFDRTVNFGFKNRLNYKIIVNWEIAEHKSQGTMQTYMNEGDYEDFWFFDINSPESYKKTEKFFENLKLTTPQ
jgi:LmbE family N-acetylglucosaminyl deacetylase